MNEYLNYFIEANIGLMLFLAAYAIVLRKETDFKSSRMFLIIGVLTSLSFPLLHITFNANSIPSLSRVIPAYLLPEIMITAEGNDNPSLSSATIQNIWFYLQWLYISGLVLFFIRFAIQFVHVLRIIRNSKPQTIGKLKIVELTDDKPTFSFFNFIFIGAVNSMSTDDKQKIILHEAVHANQLHSFDILLINIVSIFFWFNPFLKSYKKIFVQLHEFEADARAVENRDVNEYCSLLAKVALKSADFKLANYFNNSLTLKRIEMMKTIKRKIRPWKMLLIAGVIPLSFFIIACQDQVIDEVAEITKSSSMALDIPQEVQKKFDELKNANPDKKFLLMETDEGLKPKVDELKSKLEGLAQSQISHINLITPTVGPSEQVRTFAIIEYNEFAEEVNNRSKLDGEVFTMVEDTAEPPGGMREFYSYIGKKLKYPAQARRIGVEGMVFIEFTVETDGSISDARVKTGIGAGCDEEALRVIESSAKWTPGKNKGIAVKQQMVMPISFKLN